MIILSVRWHACPTTFVPAFSRAAGFSRSVLDETAGISSWLASWLWAHLQTTGL
jgi:hypothetical protein